MDALWSIDVDAKVVWGFTEFINEQKKNNLKFHNTILTFETTTDLQ